MGQSLLAAATSGLALAGVLAAGGLAAARAGVQLPHLGIGAVGAGIAVLAGRLTTMPPLVAVVLVAIAGLVAGAVAAAVDRRCRAVDTPVWPPVLLPDAAVLALGVAIAALARPADAVELPLGPLGGLASTAGAFAACAVGVAAAVAVGFSGRRRTLTWAVGVAGVAAAMALGAGSLALRGEALVPAFGLPDIVGLSVRMMAVGVVARSGIAPGLVAALVLGVSEALLRSQLAFGDAAVAPALAVVAFGVWQAHRSPEPVPTS